MTYKIRFVPPGPSLTIAGHTVEDGSYLQLDIIGSANELVQTLDFETAEVEQLVDEISAWESGFYWYTERTR